MLNNNKENNGTIRLMQSDGRSANELLMNSALTLARKCPQLIVLMLDRPGHDTIRLASSTKLRHLAS